MNSIAAPAPEACRSARYRSIRRTTLGLAAPLSAEDCALQSMPEASPVKWHLAHTTWFFETFLLPRGSRAKRERDRLRGGARGQGAAFSP